MPPHRQTAHKAISTAFIAEVRARLAADRRVRRTLPDGGRLNLDRRLPFLCVYRQPLESSLQAADDRSPESSLQAAEDGLKPGLRRHERGFQRGAPGIGAVPDAGTRQLVTGEAAYLIAPGEARHREAVAALVRGIVETASQNFGSFLIMEVWSAPAGAEAPRRRPNNESAVVRPAFRILGRLPGHCERTVARLRDSLLQTELLGLQPAVDVALGTTAHPPNLAPLLTAEDADSLRCHFLGLEVRPVYRDLESGAVYPATLRVLRRRLGRALRQTFFTFARTHTTARPQHYYALGRRTFTSAVWQADRRLAEIGDTFDFVLQVTPVNAASAWQEFKRGGYKTAPTFEYRPLTIDPALLKRRLYEIPVERIEDPTMAHLFREKQDELDRRITMLSDIGTDRFLPGSLQVYGAVEPLLLNLANEMLARISPRSREGPPGTPLEAEAFAERARAEVAHYRRLDPRFAAEVVVRDDLYTGLLVSSGNLLIGRQTVIPAARVEPLVQHEVGTHCLTYYNALAQPMRQLHVGLAGYDGLQEGLAVLAEYFAEGLSRPRLRLLAARVVAVHQMIAGAAFVDTFRLLHETFGFARRGAFTTTMRVYRGGGLSKDAVYLRGLAEVLEYLSRGGDLETLFVGKLAIDQVPMVRELLHRQVLRPASLRPRYMDNPRTHDKLTRLARGLSVLDLVEAGSRRGTR